jgi:hypothetical protein
LLLSLSFVATACPTATTTMSLIPPTRMNEQVFKGKKKAAVSGHKLLKKKADALKVKSSRWGSPQHFGNQFSRISLASFHFTRSICMRIFTYFHFHRSVLLIVNASAVKCPTRPQPHHRSVFAIMPR